MQVHDLGALELSDTAGRHRLGRRVSVVLGSLLSAAGTVSVTELRERAWPGLPAARQRVNLQTVISRLRADLRTGPDVDPLIWVGEGYRLDLAAGSVDSQLLEHQGAVAAGSPGDPLAVIAATDRIYDLWRASFLGDLGSSPWAADRRARLDDVWRRTLELRWQALLSESRAEQILSEVTAAQVDDPDQSDGIVWELAQEHRMRALLSLGRPGEALAAHAEGERALGEGAHRRPVEVLDRLAERARQASVAAPASLAPAPGRPVGASRPATPRPTLLTQVIGREDDVTRLLELIRAPDIRLISLLGPGGVGKTTLALLLARSVETGADFPDGVTWVPLSRARHRDQLLTLITGALQFEPRGSDVVSRLADYLTDRRMLLILDNVEQLPDAAEVVTDLLERCPTLRILCTSRRALNVRGEQRYWVTTLPVPVIDGGGDGGDGGDRVAVLGANPSVALLVRRAREASPGFRLSSANASAVAEICVKLDGLPLALELAASRLDLFTPQDLLGRLSVDLGVITGGPRDLPERQRTLRATLEWSFGLLTEAEQENFGKLTAFQGGFDYGAAEAILDGAGSTGGIAVAEALDGLISQSLIRTDRSHGPVRFAILETVRHFVSRQLSETEQSSVTRRHQDIYLALAEGLAPSLTGGGREHALDRLDLERENLRVALRSAVAEPESGTAMRFINALGWLWYFRGPLVEARRWCAEVLDARGGQDAGPGHAAALWNAGRLAHLQGATARAASLLADSVALWRRWPAAGGLAYALSDLGQVRWILGDRTLGRRLAEESVAAFRANGDRWGLALALQDLGQDVLASGDLEAASGLYREIEGIFADLGDAWGLGLPRLGFGRVAMATGDLGSGRSHLLEARRVFAQIGDRRLLAFALMRLGQLERRAGELDVAADWYRQALMAWRELDHDIGVANALAGLAGAAAGRGRFEQAALLAGAAAAGLDRERREMSPLDAADYAPYLARMENALSSTGFATMFGRGTRLSRAEVLALAAEGSSEGSAPQSSVGRPGLTEREREVVRLIERGMTYAQVAQALFVTPRTVGFHLGRVYEKVQVTSRHQLVELVRQDPSLLRDPDC